MRRLLVTALVIFVVLAQSALLAHELDISAHDDGHACEYCALTGSLDKPVVGMTASVHAATGVVEFRPPTLVTLSRATTTFDARAPPANS